MRRWEEQTVPICISCKLNVSDGVCAFNLLVYHLQQQGNKRHLLSLIQKYPCHPPTERNQKKIKVEVRSCSLQLSKYNSSSDTKGTPWQSKQWFLHFKETQTGPFSFLFCMVLYSHSGGSSPSFAFPVKSAWKLGQSGRISYESPTSTGDLSMEIFPHGIKQFWSKPVKNGEAMICKQQYLPQSVRVGQCA